MIHGPVRWHFVIVVILAAETHDRGETRDEAVDR